MKLTRFVEIYIEKESAKVHVKVKRENGQITVKGNSCPRIRFLLLFSLLSSFYICGGLGLGGGMYSLYGRYPLGLFCRPCDQRHFI